MIDEVKAWSPEACFAAAEGLAEELYRRGPYGRHAVSARVEEAIADLLERIQRERTDLTSDQVVGTVGVIVRGALKLAIARLKHENADLAGQAPPPRPRPALRIVRPNE